MDSSNEFSELYSDTTTIDHRLHTHYATRGMALLRVETCIEEIQESIRRLTLSRDQLYRRVVMRRFVIDALFKDKTDPASILGRKKVDTHEIALLHTQQRQLETYIGALRMEHIETVDIYNSMLKERDGPLASLVVEVDRIASIKEAQKDDVCCLCLDDVKSGSHVIELDECKHVFHYTPSDACLLIASNRCPLCRSQFVNKF